MNVERVVDALRTNGPSSQAAIARTTGLSPATITNIVRQLAAADRVEIRALNGRESLVTLTARTGTYVSLSVGTSGTTALLADFANERRRAADLTAAGIDPTDGPRAATALVDHLLAQADLTRNDLAGVAIGLQAPVSHETRAIASWASANLPQWRGVPILSSLQEQLGVPVHVDNDANLAALAEWTWGVARGSRNLFYVFASHHIGGAILLDGEVLRGADGLAGEIGHMVIDGNGPMCECGSRGCLAVYATQDAILRSLGPRMPYTTVAEVVLAARSGDLAARGVLFEVGRRLGRALANVGKLLAPELMVLGGELGRAGSLVLEGLRASIEVTSLRAVSPNVRFSPAHVIQEEVLYGGVAAALRADGAATSEMPDWLQPPLHSDPEE